MLDTTPLHWAVNERADRLRHLPESRLRRGEAAGALALARELTERAQRLENPGTEPRHMPSLGVFVVGDQLAVAGHDLAEALQQHGSPEELADALTLVGD